MLPAVPIVWDGCFDQVFEKNHRTKKTKNVFEPMYPEHFCVPKTMVASVSAQTLALTDF